MISISWAVRLAVLVNLVTMSPKTWVGILAARWRLFDIDIGPNAAGRTSLEDGVELKEGDEVCHTVIPIK